MRLERSCTHLYMLVFCTSMGDTNLCKTFYHNTYAFNNDFICKVLTEAKQTILVMTSFPSPNPMTFVISTDNQIACICTCKLMLKIDLYLEIINLSQD